MRKIDKAVQFSELKVGDVIRFESMYAWNCCIVKDIKWDNIIEKYVATLFRPYGATSDFTTTSGCICYIGVEEFKITSDNKSIFTLLMPSKIKECEGEK